MAGAVINRCNGGNNAQMMCVSDAVCVVAGSAVDCAALMYDGLMVGVR